MNPTATLSRPTATTTVELFFQAWADGDLVTLNAFVDSALVITDIPGLLYTRDVYCGHDGVAEAVRELEMRWQRFEMRVEDVRRLDDDTVSAVLRVTFEKHDMSFDADIPVRCELRDGLVVSLTGDDAAYAL